MSKMCIEVTLIFQMRYITSNIAFRSISTRLVLQITDRIQFGID